MLPQKPPESESWLSPFFDYLDRLEGIDKLSDLERLTLELQEDLDFEAIRRSNVIELSYRSKNPVWTHKVVETLTNLYLERRQALHQVPHAVAFFEEELSAAQARLDAAESELEQFVRQSGISLPLDAHKKTVLERLAERQTQLSQAQVALRQSEQRARALEMHWREVPNRLQSANRENLAPLSTSTPAGSVRLRSGSDNRVSSGFFA